MLYLDDLNREVWIHKTPERVISLCPSITETLIEMKVHVIGRTKFCIHPLEKIKNITRVGGTKSVHYEIFDSLNPDLIIAEKEENTPEMIYELEKKYPTYVINIEKWIDGIQMIKRLGEIFNKTDITNQWLNQLPERLMPITHNKRLAYLIWYEPIMTVGTSTYIGDVIKQLGFINPYENYKSRYPSLTIEDLQSQNVYYLFLSSEPFPFKSKHIETFQKKLPNTKVLLVNGEMFSWYGVRMLEALKYFRELKNLL